MTQPTPMPPDVQAVFASLPLPQRGTLLSLRDLIFEVAAAHPRVGQLEEALRWGEPAYLTPQTKSGSTIRLGVDKASGKAALFFNCNTHLVEQFRLQFGDELTYSKTRAVLIDAADALPVAPLRLCIASALLYHTRAK